MEIGGDLPGGDGHANPKAPIIAGRHRRAGQATSVPYQAEALHAAPMKLLHGGAHATTLDIDEITTSSDSHFTAQFSASIHDDRARSIFFS